MVSNLILIFCLLFAGAVADLNFLTKRSHVRGMIQGEPRATGCSAELKKNDDSNSPEVPVSISRTESECNQCDAIMKAIKGYFGKDEPKTSALTYACSEVDFSNTARCYYLIAQYPNETVELLGKQSYEICTAIRQCPRKIRYYCDACRKYVMYDGAWNINANAWQTWACSDYSNYEMEECREALKSNQDQIRVIIRRKPLSAYKICQEVQLCPSRAHASRHSY